MGKKSEGGESFDENDFDGGFVESEVLDDDVALEDAALEECSEDCLEEPSSSFEGVVVG